MMPPDSMVRRTDRQARHTRPRAAGDGSQARVCRLSLSPSGAKDRRPGVPSHEWDRGGPRWQDVWNLKTGTGDGSSWLARWCRHQRERGTSPNPRAAKTLDLVGMYYTSLAWWPRTQYLLTYRLSRGARARHGLARQHGDTCGTVQSIKNLYRKESVRTPAVRVCVQYRT